MIFKLPLPFLSQMSIVRATLGKELGEDRVIEYFELVRDVSRMVGAHEIAPRTGYARLYIEGLCGEDVLRSQSSYIGFEEADIDELYGFVKRYKMIEKAEMWDSRGKARDRGFSLVQSFGGLEITYSLKGGEFSARIKGDEESFRRIEDRLRKAEEDGTIGFLEVKRRSVHR